MTLMRAVAALVLTASLSSCGSPRPPAQVARATGPASIIPANPSFVDVAATAGLTTVLYCGGADKDHILESLGSGVAHSSTTTATASWTFSWSTPGPWTSSRRACV